MATNPKDGVEKIMCEAFPLVTVSILTYRNFDFLKCAVESVFLQNYSNIEVIISDDGSENWDIDFINYLIKHKPSNIKNIKLIHHKKNLGTVKNFNNCIKVSSGEYYIGLASDDCFYSRNTVTEIVNFYKKTGALIVTCKRAVYDYDMQEEKQILPSISDQKYLEDEQNYLYKRLSCSNFISGASTSYSRSLFEKYGNFDEDYYLLEDYPYYLKLSRLKVKIYFFDYISIKYRLGGVSTSNIPNKKFIEDSHRLIEKEILPYKGYTGDFLYDLKEFEYYFHLNSFKSKIKSIINHPIIFLLKIMNRIRLINLGSEDIIKLNER